MISIWRSWNRAIPRVRTCDWKRRLEWLLAWAVVACVIHVRESRKQRVLMM